MRRFAVPTALLALFLGFAASAAPLPSTRHKLPALDADATLVVPALDASKALAEDAAKAGVRQPLRYAIGTRVAVTPERDGKARGGRWDTLTDGRRVWRLRVDAPGAISVDVGFRRMFLPHGAELRFANADESTVWGPWTDADNTPHGQFWTPVVPGNAALIELVVPADAERHVVLELDVVRSGYRDVMTGRSPLESKSLNCHIDSVCPEGDAIREQIRAVAGYTFGGLDGVQCTGQLLNNVRQNNQRLFHSARHCVPEAGSPESVVVYWRYESPTCRTRFSSANGTPVDLSVAIPQTGGATLRMSHNDSDITLLELVTAVPPAANPYWLGWDRRDTAPTRSLIVHHSNGDEKRLSFDDDPAEINGTLTDVGTATFPPFASLDVTYDRQTTSEGGASGSALLDQNERAVASLSGGPPGSCTFGITDTYGRYFFAWEGGGTTATQLKAWLDPDNTNAQFVDGKAACAAPTLNLQGPTTGAVGTPLQYSVSATGSGPFIVEWDVDGDSVIDRRTTGVTSSTAIAPSYPMARTTTVSARVTDATGCVGQASRGLVVSAADVLATVGTPGQTCGDNDAVIEPGETWRVPVTLRNQGTLPLANGVAVFTEQSFNRPVSTSSDAFGHLVLDNTSPDCDFQFVDIRDSGTLLTVEGSADEGRTAPQALGPAGLNLFGTRIDRLVMSTNGYLSSDAEDSGNDYDNTCALEEPDRGSNGDLLRVLHDDLQLRPEGTMRRQFFTTCPRPRDAGGTAAPACTVFQWTRAGLYSVDGPVGDFTFQAIVYDGADEVVYQYLGADPSEGGGATISIQNDASTDRLQYACNQQGAARAGRAVCFFHPQALPPSPIEVRTNAVTLGNLGAGAQTTANVDFHVPSSAQCGARIDLGYAGTVDDVSASMRSATLLAQPIGSGGTCAAVNQGCGAQTAAPIVPVDGLFANPNRFGNGIASSVFPGASPVYFGAWFTGQPSRLPTWYALQGPMNTSNGPSQAMTDVLRFTFDVELFNSTSPPAFVATSARAGIAQITTVSPTQYVLTFVLDGVAGGEKQSILYPGTRPSPNRTGAWFHPAQPGWGHIVDDHFLGGTTAEQVAIEYIYGSDGVARWTLGASNALNSGPMAQTTFLVHCPTCPSFADFISFPLPAGSIDRNYTGLTTGTLSTSITLPGPLSGSWSRTNVPIQLLTPPGPQ